MRPALLLPALVALSGCIRPVNIGTCHETGRITTSCSSGRYYSSCYAGPEVRCTHRWFWQEDPEEKRMAEAHARIFGKAAEGH